jgi:hypothetical protein
MATARNNPRSIVGRGTFTRDGQRMTAEKHDRSWTLTLGTYVVETHDLSRGVDDLLGKSHRNSALVLEILEWQAGAG